MTPHDPEKLERLIHQALRSLPDRRAPHTLEARVMAALATRTALPWWRQSFISWPGAVRAGFLVLSIGAAAGLVLLGMSGSGGLPAAAPLMARLFAPVAELRAVASSLGDFCAVMIHAIPSLWLYGGLALVAVLYTALFGLSAAAYRTLYVQH